MIFAQWYIDLHFPAMSVLLEECSVCHGAVRLHVLSGVAGKAIHGRILDVVSGVMDVLILDVVSEPDG